MVLELLTKNPPSLTYTRLQCQHSAPCLLRLLASMLTISMFQEGEVRIKPFIAHNWTLSLWYLE